MTEQKPVETPAIPPAAPAPEPQKDEWYEKLKQREMYNAVVEESKKDPVFAQLFDKYEKDVKALNPNIVQTIGDQKKFAATFLEAAKVLFERDEKITAAQPPAPTTPNPPATPNPAGLDQPVPQGDAIQKNEKGEVVDASGTRLISESVRLPDLRDAELPPDASPVEKARVASAKQAQRMVKKWEKPTW